jgi:large subunit ribosomal protein L14
MLQRESNILIADNSGALEVRVINPGKVKFAKIGDIVTCSVKKMRKDINSPLVIKGQVIKVLIVCTRKGIKRNGG